ncbi:MAG: hypothetical protein HC921_22505 [Synechococcaceae cyanobacterium SM2_3_1]|nr:hypothetical protein [Synechococcaceae cyanobacterium SM2_3_1]
MMERPASITVIAILQILGAGFTVLVALLGLLFGASVSVIGSSGEATVAGGFIAAISLFTLLLGVLSLILAIGLLQMQGWAWVGTLIVQGISIVLGLFNLMNGEGTTVVGILISGLIISVLLQPNVKRAFRV